MRAGGCALQQALTAEASAIVKQAVLLAKRRGHAQVTPLHVADTMLSSAPGGLFRAACLEAHSHPLHCKALELCFNVALNRLPASSANPMLNPHRHSHNNPSISNALVAAFKRAQAHQRRGSVEDQQQSLLTIKIELEQLIISILDDPSVSRVMREAGFSSTHVKNNVEKAVSLELRSRRSSPNNNSNSPENEPERERKTENMKNVNIVLENLMLTRRRKSLVLVGECASSLESTVRGLMDKVDKGEVCDGLRELKFVTIPPLYTFCNLGREEVEQKIGELSFLVKSLLGKGVVLYLGDFKWISNYRVSLEEERRYYCSVEHVIMEIGRLIWGIGENNKFWLMGIATFQTYMRCRNGYNSLEHVWGLHPVTIPANGLEFSLVSGRDEQILAGNVSAENGEIKLSCCADCSAKFEDEARNMQTSFCNTNFEPNLSRLPCWLKDESRRINDQNQNSEAIKELYKKWNSFCSSAHKQPFTLIGKTLTISSTPLASPSFSFDQQNPDSTRTHFPLLGPTSKENYQRRASNPIHMQANENPINPLSSHSATSSHEIMETDNIKNLKEFNAENLNVLCDALEKNVPCLQKEIIPEIAGTILQCRSGMLRRKDELIRDNSNNSNNNIHYDAKRETWLCFLGPDVAQAKEVISKELAKVVFGSYSSFVSIGLSSFGLTTPSSSSGYCGNKRARDGENGKSYVERFAQAVSENPHRVFFLEDLEHADYFSKMGIKRAIESGEIRNENGERFRFCDAIIVLSYQNTSFKSSSSRACSPRGGMGNGAGAGEEDSSRYVSLDLNISFDGDAVEDEAVDGIFQNVDTRVDFKSSGFVIF